MSASGAAARTVAAARKAIDQIESDRDRVDAVRAAFALFEGLREISDEAAALRRRLVVAIVDSGVMNRQQLAAELGISGRRVGQIYQEGRRA